MAEQDLLEKFIENERKSKRWTLVSTIIICLLTLGVVIFYAQLGVKNEELKDQKALLLEKTDSLQYTISLLDSTQIELDSANRAVIRQSELYTNIINLYSRIIDSLQQEITKSGRTFTVTNIVTKSILEKQNNYKAILEDKAISSSSLNLIKSNIEKEYTVYIQYTDGFEDVANLCRNTLATYYVVPIAEKVSISNFNSSVRYFDKEDAVQAENLCRLLQIVGIKLLPEHVEMKAPSKHLEVWLGNKSTKQSKK